MNTAALSRYANAGRAARTPEDDEIVRRATRALTLGGLL